MPNVIREDVVRIGFDVDLKKLTSVTDGLDDLKKLASGGVGDDAFDDLKKSVNGSKDAMDDAKKSASNLNDKLTTLGKKGASLAFNGLKKIAGISFKVALAGVTAIAGAVGKIGYEAVQAYADFEQLKGGVETLFGAKGAQSVEEYAKSVNKSVSEVEKEYKTLKESEALVLKNANNAYKTAGLSANAYMETVTSFSASLLQSLGGDTKKAAEYADMAISDMSDNANKMGTDMGSIQFAYQGFAKGNYTMLDNLKLGKIHYCRV